LKKRTYAGMKVALPRLVTSTLKKGLSRRAKSQMSQGGGRKNEEKENNVW